MTSAVLRLQKDLEELLKSTDCDVISAMPTDDMRVWHANIKGNGQLHNCIFHISLTFPGDYPMNPPRVMLFTPFKHPNIFDSYVCLDMLNSSWLPSYTVKSILLQLQSFFCAEDVLQDYGSTRSNRLTLSDCDFIRTRTKTFLCGCGHVGSKPFPPFKSRSVALELPPIVEKDLICFTQKGMSAGNEPLVCHSFEKRWVGFRAGATYVVDGSNHTYAVEFTVDTCYGVPRVGLALKGGSENLGTDSRTWGYGGTGTKSHSGEFTPYGVPYGHGDTVGMFLDCSTGDLHFVVNGTPQGIAFTLPHGRYFPSVVLRMATVSCNWKDLQFLRDIRPQEEMGASTATSLSEEALTLLDIPHDALKVIAGYIDPYFLSIASGIDLYDGPTCFCTRKHITEVDFLGLGFKVVYYPESKTVKELPLVSYDLFSAEAYRNGLRLGPYGERFTHMIPVAINRAGFKNATGELVRVAKSVLGDGTPSSMAALIQLLMNSVVVSLNTSLRPNASGGCASYSKTMKMLSDEALQAYGYLHHTLLHIAKSYPESTATVKRQLSALKEGKADKKIIPNLGVFIAGLSVLDVSWESVSTQLFDELMARSVLFTLCKALRIKDTAEISEAVALSAYREGIVSWNLFMFYQWFHVHTHPLETDSFSLSDLLSAYDRGFGRMDKLADLNNGRNPKEQLFAFCSLTKIKRTWDFFLDTVFPQNAPHQQKYTHHAHTISILKDAFKRSEKAGYTTCRRGSDRRGDDRRDRGRGNRGNRGNRGRGGGRRGNARW